MRERSVPEFELGEFIHLDFDPMIGREQAGKRPALVVSELAFNKTGMAWVCPVTNTNRDWPFHVPLPSGLKITGVVMADQIKCIDLKERAAKSLSCKAPTSVLVAVQKRIKLILGFPGL